MKILVLVLFALITSTLSFGQQKIDTAQFAVQGVCGMCKERIELGASIKGVKYASWDKITKTMTVIYRPKKTSPAEVEQAITEVGHDTEHYKASEKAYSNLHHCCRYRDLDSH